MCTPINKGPRATRATDVILDVTPGPEKHLNQPAPLQVLAKRHLPTMRLSGVSTRQDANGPMRLNAAPNDLFESNEKDSGHRQGSSVDHYAPRFLVLGLNDSRRFIRRWLCFDVIKDLLNDVWISDVGENPLYYRPSSAMPYLFRRSLRRIFPDALLGITSITSNSLICL